jgi:hypothetical protein
VELAFPGKERLEGKEVEVAGYGGVRQRAPQRQLLRPVQIVKHAHAHSTSEQT